MKKLTFAFILLMIFATSCNQNVETKNQTDLEDESTVQTTNEPHKHGKQIKIIDGDKILYIYEEYLDSLKDEIEFLPDSNCYVMKKK